MDAMDSLKGAGRAEYFMWENAGNRGNPICHLGTGVCRLEISYSTRGTLLKIAVVACAVCKLKC